MMNSDKEIESLSEKMVVMKTIQQLCGLSQNEIIWVALRMYENG